MRFFSNDKDRRDDQPSADQGLDVQERAADVNPDQAHDDHPERVASDPVSVPQQRAGSPWSSTPDGATAPAADTGAHRADQPPVDLALDEPATGDRTGERPGDGAVREDLTPPDHAVADTSPDATADGDTTSYRPDGTVIATGATAAPLATGPRFTTDTGTTDTSTADAALKDDGGFHDPQAVDPATDKPLESQDTGAAVAPPAVPVAADKRADTVTTGTKPGAVTAPEVGALFAKDDAQALQERWRDVQLRFVDSPRDATSEAAGLVDEAVEKLTASLRSQKDALSGDNGEDTEKLRVELRGYRDMLNRILGL